MIDHIYCSPALRCVQTAVGFIKGTGSWFQAIVEKESSGSIMTFSIEPGLFEWMMWSRHGKPSWMQPAEFAKLGTIKYLGC